MFLLECVHSSGPHFQWSLFVKSEENSTSKPPFFNRIRPSQVVTALWSLHPQDFMQINRILRFCSSPVLVGVTDISHQIVVSVFLEKQRKNNLKFPEEKARKRTESCQQQESLWDFLGGNSSSGTGQERRALSAKIPRWNLLVFAPEGISFCAPGGWQLALSPGQWPGCSGVTGGALQGSLGGSVPGQGC